MIIRLCDRWHKLPHEIEEADPELLRLVTLYDLAHPGKEQEADPYG